MYAGHTVFLSGPQVHIDLKKRFCLRQAIISVDSLGLNKCHVLQQAFVDAFSSSCTSGGFVSSEQSSFADAVLSVAAETYAWVIGGPACQGMCFQGPSQDFS